MTLDRLFLAALLGATLTVVPTYAADDDASDDAAPKAEAQASDEGSMEEPKAGDNTAADKDADTATGTDDAKDKDAAKEAGATEAKDPSYVIGDIPVGDENAPLTVIEYASFTCGHCGSFHTNTWPEVKKQYVDTGKVRFILREVYPDMYGLWASMTARCAGPAGFHPIVDSLMKTQRTWLRRSDDETGAAIAQVGRRAGLSNEQLTACLSDRDYAKGLLEQYQEHMKVHNVRSTPTFIINDEVHTGDMSFEDFSKLLDAALSDS